MAKSPLLTQMAFDQIRYSMVWEDPEILQAGLNIRQTDDVLCIASAGCNILSLALQSPKRIVALDLSPAQIALVQLKITAVATLCYQDFIGLLGFSDLTKVERLGLYEKIRDLLDLPTRNFWDANLSVLEAGILVSGRLDSYFKRFREDRLVLYWSQEFIARLNSCETIRDQESWLKTADLDGLKNEIYDFFGRDPLERFARDPAQFKYVQGVDVQAEIWQRFVGVFSRHRLQDNAFLKFFLTGEFPLSHGSPYLQPARFNCLKESIKRIEIVQTDLESFLSTHAEGSFSKIALSDVFEYMSDPHALEVFSSLEKILPAGGRLAYWNLFLRRAPDPMINPNLRRLISISEALSKADRFWLYKDFNVYEKIS